MGPVLDMSEEDFKISKETLRKLRRKVNREVDIELGKKQISKIHKTSRKDLSEKKPNTVKRWEADE